MPHDLTLSDRKEPQLKLELQFGESAIGFQFDFRTNHAIFVIRAEDKTISFSKKLTSDTKEADRFFRKIDTAILEVAGADGLGEALSSLKNNMLKLLPPPERKARRRNKRKS